MPDTQETSAKGVNWLAWGLSALGGVCAVVAAYKQLGEPAAWAAASAWLGGHAGVTSLK